ncbi:MAG TPA: hypothetical protein VGW34_10800 [Allosphingosinicella sp.]|nr:hypothetical protein [Allosphingosinicella sp.]
MDDRKKDEGPLSAEAVARDEWRGGETLLDEGEAAGHTLPESERDRAGTKPAEESRAGSAGIVPPPD